MCIAYWKEVRQRVREEVGRRERERIIERRGVESS